MWVSAEVTKEREEIIKFKPRDPVSPNSESFEALLHTQRLPSITIGAMAEAATQPAPDAMQGVIGTAPVAAPIPEEPEAVSETLYIQNLNEKIKIDGE